MNQISFLLLFPLVPALLLAFISKPNRPKFNRMDQFADAHFCFAFPGNSAFRDFS